MPKKPLTELQAISILQQFLSNTSILCKNDDSIAVSANGEVLVLNIDTIAQSTDFIPSMTLWEAGWKLVAVCVSDIAAKGVKASSFLSSISLPKNTTEKVLTDIASGIEASARYHDVAYIGGDLGTSTEIILTGVSFGFGSVKNLKRRDDLEVGDLICVTGSFGETSLAFAIKLQNVSLPKEVWKEVANRVKRPIARVIEGQLLGKSSGVSASIDSSDGLAISLNTLATLSEVRIVVDTLPVTSWVRNIALENSLDLLELVFYGGEEFELVFGINPQLVNDLKRLFSENNVNFTIIGRVTAGKGVVFNDREKTTPVKFKGWDALQARARSTENDEQ